jgi:hypothetical protein
MMVADPAASRRIPAPTANKNLLRFMLESTWCPDSLPGEPNWESWRAALSSRIKFSFTLSDTSFNLFGNDANVV